MTDLKQAHSSSQYGSPSESETSKLSRVTYYSYSSDDKLEVDKGFMFGTKYVIFYLQANSFKPEILPTVNVKEAVVLP